MPFWEKCHLRTNVNAPWYNFIQKKIDSYKTVLTLLQKGNAVFQRHSTPSTLLRCYNSFCVYSFFQSNHTNACLRTSEHILLVLVNTFHIF